MTFRQAFAATAAGLLLCACGETPSTPIRIVESARTTTRVQHRRLASALDALSRQTSYHARNRLMIENVLGDAADGEAVTRVDVSETRSGDLYEVFIVITGETTETRGFVAQGATGAFTLFVKGPAPDLGIEGDAWHVTSDQTLINDRLHPLPTRVLPELLSAPDAIEAAFDTPVEVNHDGGVCRAYRAPASKLPTHVMAGFFRMFNRVDALDLSVTLCDDGLPRVLQINGNGLGTTDASKPGRVEVLLEFAAFGNARSVRRPDDARPLEIRPPEPP
jgi:hypothetical protein